MDHSNDYTGHTPGRDKRLSIDHCRNVLSKNGKSYTDGEVKQIRDLLYTFAHIEKNAFELEKSKEEKP